jgi:hypothetical protein
LSENEKSCRVNLKEDKIGNSFFDEIESMKAKDEPKSGLIRQVLNKHARKNSSFLILGGSAIKRNEYNTFIGKLSAGAGSSLNSMAS